MNDLIAYAAFKPEENDSDESVTTQRTRFRTTSHDILANGLLDRSEALQRIAQRVYGEGVPIGLQPGESIEVHIRADHRTTHIEVKTHVPRPATNANAGGTTHTTDAPGQPAARAENAAGTRP
ncbi:MAG: hypothetical protein F4X11_22840 [Acidobacteria bacterium]|nr:hypothetical protein [Chloroflexota bacterium]MYN67830.1 hypothetical protein [Acidobacteriota bacterium]